MSELAQALQWIRDKSANDPDVESWKWLARAFKEKAAAALGGTMSEDIKTPKLPGIEPKFIQIAVAPAQHGHNFLYALDEAGQVWSRTFVDNYKELWVPIATDRKQEV